MLYVISGPTASGKSALAVAWAQQCNGEVINADAMQLYAGLDVGTAKITLEEQGGIAHHLFSVLDMNERCDVYTYVRMAEEKIANVCARGKNPILCGGSGYYIKALLYGLDDLPGNESLRAELDLRYDRDDAEEALHARMKEEDPEDYAAFQSNRRKLIRALEVFLTTGKPLTAFHTGARSLRYTVCSVTLRHTPERLRERIADRTKKMFCQAWFDETRRAEAHGFFRSPTAHQAIGYRIVRDYLNGVYTREEAITLIINRTAQYARRQRAWFNHQCPETHFAAPENALSVLKALSDT